MPTHKADLSRLSITQLRELTGRSAPTVRKRLKDLDPVAKDGRTIWYDARAALALLIGGEGLDLTTERARLAAEQADAQELKNAVTRGDLVYPDAMDRATVALATTVSGRLQGLGTAIAQSLAVEATVAGCQGIVNEAIDKALHELVDAAERASARLDRAKSEKPSGKGGE